MYEVFYRLLDELRGSWRFRTYAMLCCWGVCLVGWAFVFSLPDMYQSSTRIFIDTRTALRPVIQGLTIEQEVGSQLNFVRNALLSRPHLEAVAEETGFFGPQHNTPGKRIAVIESMAERIQLNVQDGGRDVGMLFSVTYQDQDRERSLEVVKKLITAFMQDTLVGKRDGSEMAQKFLRDQLDEYERRLSESEQRLAEFKKRNVGLMPGTQGDYFTRLQAEIARLERAQEELRLAQARREELGRQLRGDAAVASLQTPAPQVPGAEPANDTASRIQETRRRMEELLLRFTEKHPDVVSLRETLAQLEARREQEIAQLREGRGALPAVAATNPVVQSIQLAINQTDVEIVGLQNRVADAQQKVHELKTLVDTAPEVEAELARLNRDYDVTRQQYNLLLERYERARLGEQAEQTQSIRFEVIDPPSANFRPVSPNRPMLVLFVLCVGLGCGGALAFLLHQIKPVFMSTRSLHSITRLPVLGSVRRTWADRRRVARYKEIIRFGAAAFCLILVCAVVMYLNIAGYRLGSGPG
jgi:polysaccharide chain length determinant protein (PEP-CTERM system associated)